MVLTLHVWTPLTLTETQTRLGQDSSGFPLAWRNMILKTAFFQRKGIKSMASALGKHDSGEVRESLELPWRADGALGQSGPLSISSAASQISKKISRSKETS